MGDVEGFVPAVAISNLKEGDTVPFGSEISLLATVTDKDFNVSKVEFLMARPRSGKPTRHLFRVPEGDWRRASTPRVVATDATGLAGFAKVGVIVKEVVPWDGDPD